MTAAQVPTIFSETRRCNRVLRSAARLRRGDDAARFIIDDMAEDVAERLAFVRHAAKRPLVIGQCTPDLADALEASSGALLTSATRNPAEPLGDAAYDLVVTLGQLDAVNDLPGALIHMRQCLEPGGLAIASFVGGASLPRLRAAMLAADGEHPAARIHPMVDPRAAPGLLQRAGWKDPVVDTHTLTVRYSSLDRLVHDLRDQGLTSTLADHAPPLGKAALQRARSAFLDQADADGKVAETFEIVTLTGRRSMSGT